MITVSKNLSLPTSAEQVEIELSTPSQGVVETLGQIEGEILVLGAGGKMGLHLCGMISKADALAGRKPRVTAISRFSSVHGKQAFILDNIPTLSCDLEDEAALAKLPDAPNIVFMAGAKFGTGDQPDLLQRMNAELPRKVAKRFSGARCIVFSTGCVYSMTTPESGGSVESDPTDPPGDYAQSCLQRELAFTEAAREHGSKVALIRLNYATEWRYGVMVDIAQKVAQGEPLDLSTGWVNVIWQRDAIDHILQAFPLASTEPFILNVTGREILSVKELAIRFGERLGRKPVFVGNENETAWLNDASFSHERFGLPPTSIEEIIEATAAWLEANKGTFGKPTGFEKRDGKF